LSRVVPVRTSRLANFIAFQRNPLQFMLSMLYEGDIIALRTGLKTPSFVVNSPDFINEILVTKEHLFKKGRTSEILRRTVGDGLLTAEKNNHRNQRRYMQPSFYKERIQEYARIVREETIKVVAKWQNGQQLLIHDEMMQLTLSIITRTMFATDVEATKAKLAAAVNVTMEQTARTLFFPIVLPLSFPLPGHRKHQQANRTLEEMIYTTIEDAKFNPEKYAMTMLGMLLDTKDEQGHPLSDHEIRDQMMTMLLAGHETTANLLTWVWVMLAQHPEITSLFHQEIDLIDWEQKSAFEIYRGMEYTQRIVQESLRLYPPAWIILREANEAIELLGEHFPRGSIFMISPYAIHRNHHVFEQPLQFRPERFADGSSSRWAKFAYFPFGGGSRSCIGSQFAMMESLIMISTIGQRCEFEWVEPRSLEGEPLVSLRLKGGAKMKVNMRTQA
jgi:cytochrome P450